MKERLVCTHEESSVTKELGKKKQDPRQRIGFSDQEILVSQFLATTKTSHQPIKLSSFCSTLL
jgi:hypothetical protein